MPRYSMRAVIVEDDYLQADWLKQTIQSAFHGAQVDCIRTEYAFRQALADLRKSPPDVLLLDVMLRWTNPGMDVSAPDDVREGQYYRAGLRCERLLREFPETKALPVILYTMLEGKDLKEDFTHLSSRTCYVGKDSDASQLIQTLRDLI